MGLKLSNNAVSKLTAGITNASTSISLTPGTGALFPTLGAGDYFPATMIKSDGTYEVIRVTARSSDVLTVTRGQEGTAAVAFSAGDRIELRMTAGAFGDLTSAMTNSATSKTSPVDADEIPLGDSAASYGLKKLTWASLKSGVFSALGALIAGGTAKATPVDADALAIMDSAASNATKTLTWANLKSTLKTYFDTLYLKLSGGTMTGALTLSGDGTNNLHAVTKQQMDAGDRLTQNSQSAAYTCVLTDAQKHILHPSADTTARTFTIPANASVSFPIGTAITFINQAGAGVVTIAITTDTMRMAGSGATGSRTLAANGIATALKVTSTEWIISGVGLS